MSETQAIDWESRYRDGTTGWERPGLNPDLPRLARAGKWRRAASWSRAAAAAWSRWRSPKPASMSPWWMRRQVRSPTQRAYSSGCTSARAEQADLFAWDPDAPFDAI